jgi:hypothetical protein
MTATSTPDQDTTLHPAEILIHVVVILLAPMFITAADGNIGLARRAALETINAYRVRNHASLMTVAKVIGFGLATLGSLSLSMTDDLSIPLILRLRGNANALDRSADRNERKLEASHPAATEPSEPDYDEAEVRAQVAEAQRRAAEVRARSQAPKPRPPEPQAPEPPAAAPKRPLQVQTHTQPAKPTAAPAAAPRPQAQPYSNLWAAAMAEVAAEEIAAAAHLPPAQRRDATERAAILSDTANALLSGQTLERPRPGDLDGLTKAIPTTF